MMQILYRIANWAIVPMVLVAAGYQGQPIREEAAPKGADLQGGQGVELADTPSGADQEAPPADTEDGEKESSGFEPIRAPAEMAGKYSRTAPVGVSGTRAGSAFARQRRSRIGARGGVSRPAADGGPVVPLGIVATSVLSHAPPQ